MPTLVTVPPPTGAKSHASGPVVLLMVLEGGVVVCAEAVGALRNRNKVADARSRKAPETKVRKRASRMKPPRECAQGAAKHLEFFVTGMCWFLAARAEMAHTSDKKLDRKSTRLNSSHQIISYAVFCLKKQKTKLLVDVMLSPE